MSDVARVAGVSLGTVSNAFNQPHKVAPATLRRVLSAVDDLGFVPNRAARALAAGTSTTVGFVITDLSNSFFLDMTRGAEKAGRTSAKSLLLANADLDQGREDFYLNLFDEERVAGILLAPVARDLTGARRARDHGRPVVLLNEHSADAEFCSVVVDDELGGYLAAQHLIGLGRKRLAFVGGPDRLEPVRERRVGVERAVQAADGAVSLELLPTDEVQVEDGRIAGAALARRPRGELPDAIVAAADLLAMGIVQALDSAGVRFPDDIAIIGYDNNRAARDALVPLSTVEQPGPEMGDAAMRLLLDEVENPLHVHQSVVLDPAVIGRQSSIGSNRRDD